MVALLLKPTPAHAASISSPNIEAAKKIIQDAAQGTLNKNDNSVTTDNFIKKPLIIDTQITPEVVAQPARSAIPTAIKVTTAASTPKVKAVSTPSDNNSDTSASAHRFPYGYCTYYVSEHRYIPWSGNAIEWLAGARSYGFATGGTPAVNAIMVTTEGGRTGHVALVDSVGDGTITVSEMNYEGFGIISSRTISVSSGFIMGYIY